VKKTETLAIALDLTGEIIPAGIQLKTEQVKDVLMTIVVSVLLLIKIMTVNRLMIKESQGLLLIAREIDL
jgi:hypothetical protein